MIYKKADYQRLIPPYLYKELPNNIYKKFGSLGIRNFSIPHPKYKDEKIVFSTDPYDIATMSMRGISSCMRWGSCQSDSLVGSIIDPYCGIIYVTDGKLCRPIRYDKGYRRKESMISRSVVRVIESSSKRKPSLFLEEEYSDDGENYGENNDSYYFEKALLKMMKKDKLSKNFIALDGGHLMPSPAICRLWKSSGEQFLTYSDYDWDYNFEEEWDDD